MILDRFLFGGTGLGHTEYHPFCGAEQWKININFTTPLQEMLNIYICQHEMENWGFDRKIMVYSGDVMGR